MMSGPLSPLWLSGPSNLSQKIETCIETVQVETSKPVYVFFRADDVAVPGKNLDRLINLFATKRVPLSLSVVPAWLTRTRWQQIKSLGRTAPLLWCWHQHGWRHKNHETTGKKQEFGPGRPSYTIRKDLILGRQRLEKLMEKDFDPIFTPPWNRCDYTTLELLKKLGYHAVSRSNGSRPSPPEGLPDFQVNVDLHTRKAGNPFEDWKCFFTELRQALLSGLCGIMIHHQRMNTPAFTFLELLLDVLAHRKGIHLVNLKTLSRSFY
jgi:peptidoglycan/xylan/chitin deacetylase (PgdA/CDA1 family)